MEIKDAAKIEVGDHVDFGMVVQRVIAKTPLNIFFEDRKCPIYQLQGLIDRGVIRAVRYAHTEKGGTCLTRLKTRESVA